MFVRISLEKPLAGFRSTGTKMMIESGLLSIVVEFPASILRQSFISCEGIVECSKRQSLYSSFSLKMV